MRRRLLYDGHGTGDDKKISNLSRNIAKLCLVDNQEDFPKLHATILRDISSLAAIADKQIKLSERCDRSFGELNKAIQEQEEIIKQAEEDLVQLKLEIDYVDKLKKISVYPDCVTTRQSIEQVERRKEQLMERLKKYRLHIKTVIESCRNLRKIFEDA